MSNEAESKPAEYQYEDPEPGVVLSVIAGLIFVVAGVYFLLFP